MFTSGQDVLNWNSRKKNFPLDGQILPNPWPSMKTLAIECWLLIDTSELVNTCPTINQLSIKRWVKCRTSVDGVSGSIDYWLNTNSYLQRNVDWVSNLQIFDQHLTVYTWSVNTNNLKASSRDSNNFNPFSGVKKMCLYLLFIFLKVCITFWMLSELSGK